jgi:hypothetical protein
MVTKSSCMLHSTRLFEKTNSKFDLLSFVYAKENWSAFAPDFKELDENIEYEERESEFDLEDEDKSIQTTKSKDDEDIEVDITTNEPIQAFLSRYFILSNTTPF